MRIFLVGGGTGGPTAPLIAVAEAVKELAPKTELFLVTGRRGTKAKLLNSKHLNFTYLTLPAGKWRRYFSWWNFLDPLKIFFGFLKGLYLIRKYHPDIIFGAGSYVQVPICWAGYVSGVPVVIHQQDFDPILSTKLVAPIAKKITVTFHYTAKLFASSSGLFKKFRPDKVLITGNPVRRELLSGSREKARELFDLKKDLPTVLVIGGGSGSEAINKIILKALPELARYVQIIHLTGGKLTKGSGEGRENYHPFDFLTDELKHAYRVADLVIARGGLSTLSELCLLKKPAILIPLPDSPQEDNVSLAAVLHAAAGLAQANAHPKILVPMVRKILWSKELQEELSTKIGKLMPHDADKKIARVLLKLYDTNSKG